MIRSCSVRPRQSSQAEGKRLSCDEDTWDRELGELFAETPIPRPRAPQVGTTTPVRRRPRAAPPRPAAGVCRAALSLESGAGYAAFTPG